MSEATTTKSNPTPNNLRTIVRSAYDLQKLRIQTGNRIVANFKLKLGQMPGEKEETLDEDSRSQLEIIRLSFGGKVTEGAVEELEASAKKEAKATKVITDLIDKHYKAMAPDDKEPNRKKFKADAIISDYTEFTLISHWKSLVREEEREFRQLGKILEDYPVYTEFLAAIKGIGPAMAGVIISEIDIHTAKYASSIWRYAGLDVALDGKGRSRRKEHLVPVAYIDKNGQPAERVGITFNPFLKTKLCGVLGASFLRSGGPYKEIYDNYKHRLECHPKWQDTVEKDEKTGKVKKVSQKLHRHNAAIRYMIKIFLIDLYKAWRKIEGLEVFAPYHEAKLGIIHTGQEEEFKKAA